MLRFLTDEDFDGRLTSALLARLEAMAAASEMDDWRDHIVLVPL
jgi:hypothetical protein